jgi:hypothetical protein
MVDNARPYLARKEITMKIRNGGHCRAYIGTGTTTCFDVPEDREDELTALLRDRGFEIDNLSRTTIGPIGGHPKDAIPVDVQITVKTSNISAVQDLLDSVD